MVKLISAKEQQSIHAATVQAEAKAQAHIVTVIMPASDTYSHYIMLCGVIVASLLDIFLWNKKIISDFPTLLSIQLLFAVLFPFIPGMKSLVLKFLPKQIYHHRAAQVAAEKRLAASKNVGAATPVLVIFISYAERYVHIFPNAVIREKVPDKQWEGVVHKLIRSIPKMKLASACVQAIEESGDILSNPETPL